MEYRVGVRFEAYILFGQIFIVFAHWEACALGFLYAKEDNLSEDYIESYLIKLDNLLSSTAH